MHIAFATEEEHVDSFGWGGSSSLVQSSYDENDMLLVLLPSFRLPHMNPAKP